MYISMHRVELEIVKAAAKVEGKAIQYMNEGLEGYTYTLSSNIVSDGSRIAIFSKPYDKPIKSNKSFKVKDI